MAVLARQVMALRTRREQAASAPARTRILSTWRRRPTTPHGPRGGRLLDLAAEIGLTHESSIAPWRRSSGTG